jgi:hypothetical protein
MQELTVIDSNTHSIENKLRQAWRQQRRYFHLRGASRFLIWLVFMIVLDFLIDWGIFFQARMTFRIGLLLLVINIAVLGWVLWSEWLRNLRPFNPLLVALEVESQHPELASLLVSYTQLDGPAADQSDVSLELIEAMRQEAVMQTHTLDFREIVNFGQLKNLLLVAGVVFLVFGAVSFTNQGHLQSLIQRLAGIDATYPTKTRITDVSGDLTIRAGDSASVMASATGVIPDGGRIFTKPVDGDGGWTALPLKKDDNQPAFRRELKEVVKDTYYYVRIGDDQSEQFRISVVPAPLIVATKVDLSYPAYMEKDASQVDQLDVEVPEGTQIQWHLTCDTAIKRMRITTFRQSAGETKEQTIEADVDASGKNITFAVTADKAFKYTFHWTESESGQDFEYGDVRHSVRVTADTVPEVVLIRPASDRMATVKKIVKMVARATDDHGLADAWLVYSLDGSEDVDASKEHKIRIHNFNGARSDEFSYAWELQEAIEGLKPGIRITFAVEVVDRSPAALGHRRRSAARQFTVVDTKTYLAWSDGEFAAQRDDTKQVRDSERTASAQVKRLREQETITP